MDSAPSSPPLTPAGPPPEPAPMNIQLTRVLIIGVITGIIGVSLYRSIRFLGEQRRALLEYAHEHPTWGWAMLPAIGLLVGCLIGLVMQWANPGWFGKGMSHVKGAMLRVAPTPVFILVPVKFIGTALAVGVGMSLGRQDPTIQMGAAIGQSVGRMSNLPNRVIAQLVACGAGAGMAVAFDAPLAGLLFVIEELRRDLSTVVYTGALIAALVATVVAREISADVSVFRAHLTGPQPHLAGYLTVALVGATGGLIGAYFGRSVVRATRIGREQRLLPAWMLPGVVAAICGAVLYFEPDVGLTREFIQDALNDQHADAAIKVLLVTIVGRLVLTLLSVGSGAPGGIFGPLLVIGALYGRVAGRVVEDTCPNWMHIHHGQTAVLGMAAVFAGCIRAPLTAIVLIDAITGEYDILLPSAVACAAAYIVAERASVPPIYDYLLTEDLKDRTQTGKLSELARVVIGVQFRSALDGKTLSEVTIPIECAVVGIERNAQQLTPSDKLRIRAGDRLTVVASADAPQALDAFSVLCTGY